MLSLVARRLFRKVDATGEGHVTCDEFLEFMLDRETLRAAEKSALGGGRAAASSGQPQVGGRGGGGGLAQVCLKLLPKPTRRAVKWTCRQSSPHVRAQCLVLEILKAGGASMLRP